MLKVLTILEVLEEHIVNTRIATEMQLMALVNGLEILELLGVLKGWTCWKCCNAKTAGPAWKGLKRSRC